jgi:putative endonuclease
MKMNSGFTYILSNYKRTVFYIGVTNNLERRTIEHSKGVGAKFNEKYKCKYLVYYEQFSNIEDEIRREKQLKNWHRDWKINLIKSINPEMKDLHIGEE